MNIEETKKAIAVMQAYVDGKRLKRWGASSVANPSWDWDNNPGTYTVVREVIRTKRFLYNSSAGPVVHITTDKSNSQDPREQWANFIRWIDTDWQEVEV